MKRLEMREGAKCSEEIMTGDEKNPDLFMMLEIDKAVNLCTLAGRINPEAAGWSRFPVQTCSLSGHAFRKKRWNRWYVSGKDTAFTIAISDIDYAGFVSASFMDMRSGETAERTVSIPFGRNIYLGDTVDSHASFQNESIDVQIMKEGGAFSISLTWLGFSSGKDLCAELSIGAPKRHESLNAVIPGRTQDRFRFTSKQNCLFADGFVSFGNKRYDFTAKDSSAFFDFSRGVFPFRAGWTHGMFSGTAGGKRIGFSAAASQNDNPGSTENALWIGGKVIKLHEPVVFSHDAGNGLNQWALRTERSDAVDLIFTPSAEIRSRFGKCVVSYAAHFLHGKYRGSVRAGRKKIEIRNLPGWCEEHTARW
jgi:hypothetical protein